MERSPCSDEFEKLLFRINSPRVVIDNAVCPDATVVKVDSARKRGNLLEAVQVLTDLDLSIKKAYISSDGRWFMDVFHVTDEFGNKLKDESVISYIEQSLGSIHHTTSSSVNGMTALELTGTDRLGLLSEVFAVLVDLKCNVVEAKVWTHNGRIASVLHIKDGGSGSPIEDVQKMEQIEGRLRNVLKGVDDVLGAKTSVSMGATHPERRLHQMMYADRDFSPYGGVDSPVVTVLNHAERGYTAVNVQCKDRAKLLFDVVCNLTDMQFVVFHGTVKTAMGQAYLEFYIRHVDGTPVGFEAERQRMVQCLRAAIQRRASEGVRLELRAADGHGVLADVTRAFRENGLNVARAEVAAAGGVFYVTDAAGKAADAGAVESVRRRVGEESLQVKEAPPRKGESWGGGAALVSLGSLVRKNLYNLGLIRSYS